VAFINSEVKIRIYVLSPELAMLILLVDLFVSESILNF